MLQTVKGRYALALRTDRARVSFFDNRLSGRAAVLVRIGLNNRVNETGL